MLIQQPFDTKADEKDKFNICQRVTAERIRRVLDGYTRTNQKGEKNNIKGLHGSFTYARLGAPLFGEYREMGERLPPYEELAKYIFYTETSTEFDSKGMNEKTGKIGAARRDQLLSPLHAGGESRPGNGSALACALDKAEKNHQLVVYCEKIWVHRDDLAKYEAESGRKVRPMLVPFNLK